MNTKQKTIITIYTICSLLNSILWFSIMLVAQINAGSSITRADLFTLLMMTIAGIIVFGIPAYVLFNTWADKK